MPEKKFEIKVPALYAPKRIDVYLAEAWVGVHSRADIKTALDEGRILLNGKPAKPRTLVKEGDVLSGHAPAEKESKLVGENIPLSVVYEDESLLVIDKPVGMVVHPGAGHSKGTLVQALLGRGSALSDVGGAFRPGIVHRLDKDTSGLLLVAKTNTAHRRLQSQFAARSLSKTYIALVRGHVEYQEGRIEHAIGRDPKERRKMAVSSLESAREALTHYRVLKRFRHATLLELRIITGRTHQIRVHLTHLGYPVMGDTLYGTRVAASSSSAPRLALHASKIEFEHPKSGKIMRFESPLPAEMKKMIEEAEKKG